MRKTILLTAVVFCTLISAKAQLAGTKWQGIISIPMQNGTMTPFPTVWEFKTDTLSVVYAMGKLPTDVMLFTEDNGVMTIRKISGSVPCDGDAIGKYAYEVKNDQLFIRKIEDACPARGGADLSKPFDRVK
jgi:hypothetical protein